MLCDFNDLYVISVGLSMTYIYLESTEYSKYFFLKFLSGIGDSLKDFAVWLKFRKSKNEEVILTKADYFIDSGKLSNETAGGLKLIREKAKEIIVKLNEHSVWIENKLKYHTQTNYLEVISLDAFFYALVLLYVGAYENKEQMDVAPLLFVLCIVMLCFSLHCICADHIDAIGNSKWSKPRKVVHTLLFGASVCLGLNIESAGWLTLLSPYIIKMTPMFCFIGFIGYLLVAFLILILVMLVYYCKVFSIKDKSKEHMNDINRYREELERVEESFNADVITLEVNTIA